MQKKIAIFPGPFDPLTLGHVDVVNRALPLFDEVIIAIGSNSQKNSLYTLEQRSKWIEQVFAHEPKVKVDHYDGLTINYCVTKNAHFIIRGIRSAADFEYEKTIADANRTLDKTIETVFLTGEPKYTSVASTIVRDIIRNGGNATPFLPEVVSKSLIK